MTSELERTPAHDDLAERCALGCMMLTPDAIADVIEALDGPGDFYRPAHELIYRTITTLYELSQPVDMVTVAAELVRTETIGRAGGAPYLHTLVSSVPTAAHTARYAAIVAEKAVLRRLSQACTRGVQRAERGADSVDAIADAIEAEVLASRRQRNTSGPTWMGDSMEATLDAIEARGNRGSELSGVPTGFSDLDSLTDGLHPGQLIIAAARPGMGKSVLLTDLARAAAVKGGRRVLTFSLEMTTQEINMRVLAAEARVALHHMRSGTMTDDDWTKLARRTPEISASPLYIDDTPGHTVGTIRATARRLHARDPLGLICVDYLQLITGTDNRRERHLQLGEISRGLKLLARELNVPVVAACQLNRGPEQRTDKKPTLADLRGSGEIEQDADVVILIHREDAHEKESRRAGEADLIVAKHRNGPLTTITVAFQGHYSRFVDMAQS